MTTLRMGTLTVKQKGRHLWFAQRDGSEHARWGTKQEITEDVRHYLRTGRLPRATAGRPW